MTKEILEQLELFSSLEAQEIDGKHWIAKSNELIEATYFLNLHEWRILLILASKIKKDDESLQLYRFRVKDLADKIGIKGNGIYQQIERTVDQLQTRRLELITKDGTKIKLNWLIKSVYKDGSVYLQYHPDLKTMFLNLHEYTKYQLDTVLHFSSFYAYRLYELLKQYLLIQKREFDVESLRRLLGIDPDKYKKYNHFKTRILEPYINEVNNLTDLKVTFKELKTGRKITHIQFYISSKNNMLKTPKEKSRLYLNINDRVSKHGYYVEEKTVLRWEQLAKEKWGHESENNLLFLIDEVNHNTDVNNPIGYITAVLKSKDDLDSFVANKKLTKEEIRRRQLMLGLKDNAAPSKEHSVDISVEERAKRKAKLLMMLEE